MTLRPAVRGRGVQGTPTAECGADTTTPTHPQHDSQPPTRHPATQIRWRVAQGPQEDGATREHLQRSANLLLHTTHPPHTHPTSIFACVWRHLYLKSTVVPKQIWNIHLITLQGRYCTPLDLMIHFVCNKTGFFAYSTQRTAAARVRGYAIAHGRTRGGA